MSRGRLVPSTLVVLALALTIGLEAALADVPQQAAVGVSGVSQRPACGGPPCGAGVSVVKDGTGSGTVTSVPAGIDCGPTCARNYPWHTPVALTATPAAGSAFTGWSGACTGNRACKANAGCAGAACFMVQATATFTLISDLAKTLSVSEGGAGYGTVSSTPAGIDCRANCVSEYALGTSVTLAAAPDDWSTFKGWSGACRGNGTCTVRIGAQAGVAVAAVFALIPCVVPDAEGKTLAAARRAINSHECSVGRITHGASRTVKKGLVLSQKPKPGLHLAQGAKVNLVVSSGRRRTF